jgi:hypothetical protein
LGRLISVKQSDSVPSDLRRNTMLWFQRPQAFTEVCRDGDDPGKLGYMSLTLREWATCYQLLPQVRWVGMALVWSDWGCNFLWLYPRRPVRKFCNEP